MFFSAITKNSHAHSEILVKIQILVKDKMRLRMKNFDTFGVHQKIKI